ncbi:hypothetical protein ACS0TY_018523 [Phlomoides rotata]
MGGMESNLSSDTWKKSDKGSTTRRVCTFQEEYALVNGLKELVARGYKVDNGFKEGYVRFLENVLKKHYGSLSSIFHDSGIGLHNTSDMIDVPEDKWVVVIKKYPLAHSLKNKSFPFYNDWKEIFGKDRATGENS